MMSSSRSFADRDAGDQSSFDKGDVAFIILAGALVFLMIPGLAFLYSGLARRKSALSLIWLVCFSNAVVIFQWFLWGYSLAFSSTATNGFIGNLRHFGLRAILDGPSPGSPLLPELLYSFYQMEFACVTVGILVGAVAERGRVLPAMVFTFVWMTLVYCPLACWVWNPSGWAFKFGVLDYAGGGPVEIGSGVSGLAYALILGPRHPQSLLNFRPHNITLVGLGTFLLWFGWLGFNGGSAFGANLRAVFAIWNSMLAAALGGIVWCFLDWRIERKFTFVGFCSGTIAGLVAATPASGFIEPWAAFVMGIVSGALCNFATKLKFLFRIDDALDLFAEHAIGGIIGLLFNAFFATHKIISLDNVNTSLQGGWLDSNWKQLYIQLAYICATCGYSFVVTAAIAWTLGKVPGMELRASEGAEVGGIDDDQIGEFANDYIEVRRDFDDWTPPSSVEKSWADKQKTSRQSSAEEHDNETVTSVEGGRITAGDRHGHPDVEFSRHHQQEQQNMRRSEMMMGEKARISRVRGDAGEGLVAAGDRHGTPDVEKQR